MVGVLDDFHYRSLRSEVEPLVVMLAPFCPHLSEELWERLGHDESIFEGTHWPSFDPEKTIDHTITLAIQVNGKVRAKVIVPASASEEEVRSAALSEEKIQSTLAAK